MSEKEIKILPEEESMRGANFNLYNRLMELVKKGLRGKVKPVEHTMTLRLPEDVNDLVEGELKYIANNLGVRLSKRELLEYAIIEFFNYKEHDQNKGEYHKRGNKSSLFNFVDENKERLQEEFKEILFKKHFEQVKTTKYARKK